jgi:hypothetical protein
MRDGSARPLRVTIRQASSIDLLAGTDRTAYEQNAGALQGVFIGELNSELRPQPSHGFDKESVGLTV